MFFADYQNLFFGLNFVFHVIVCVVIVGFIFVLVKFNLMSFKFDLLYWAIIFWLFLTGHV